MRYRRALVLVDPDAPSPLAELARVAPSLERVLVVASLAPHALAWLLAERVVEPDERALAAVEALRSEARTIAPRVDVQLAPELDASALVELALSADADLLVSATRSLRRVSALTEARRRLALPILWATGEAREGRIEHVWCVAIGQRARRSIATFLRDHGDPSLGVTVLAPMPPTPDELAAMIEVAGIRASVEAAQPGASLLRRWLAEWTPERQVDLVVLTQLPRALLLSVRWPAPVLVLPPPPVEAPRARDTLDVCDVLDDGARIRARIEVAPALGPLAPLRLDTVAFVAAGVLSDRVLTSTAGDAEIAGGAGNGSLGVLRVGDELPADALSAIELGVSVVRAGGAPVIAYDAELDDARLEELRSDATLLGAEPLAVRLRPTRSAAAIRERLRALGLPPVVLDARAVLDEGEAIDVWDAFDAVRLRRVAARLASAGLRVHALTHRDGPALEPAPPAAALPSVTEGNRIEVELDNALARRWLLTEIGRAERHVHLQIYMAADDHVGAAVERALVAASERGVAVRIVVDSLFAQHGTLGVHNELVARLEARAGIEVRAWHPVRELSFSELRQRDHRKLVVIDDRLALVGGRNLAHEYYVGFDEVPLGTSTTWRDVPWLDAGARLEGPVVREIASSFASVWVEAGGAPLALATPEPAGSTRARVVLHRGQHDAHTLDAYRALIEGARSHVMVANGFPLVLELQHVLLRALARGVRVRVLTGHVAPLHEGELFEGPWASARTAATELVHSRLDPIVDEGGEVHLLTTRDVPGWDPSLGAVRPHVHAKLMTIDGERVAVGSANLDLTSAYWESELMVIVEDASIARSVEARLEAHLAASPRLDSRDRDWRERAARRAWMRHWPGALSF